MKKSTTGNLSQQLELFFIDYLANQRKVSPHTIMSYRDTFRLLLKYIHIQTNKMPAELNFEDIDVKLIRDFLNYLEAERGVKARSRNQRLAAIHSFYHYVAFNIPEMSHRIQKILLIPQKKYEKALVCYLTRPEIDALLNTPDRSHYLGRRNHMMILLLIQTGLRVSELVELYRSDIVLGSASYIRCVGKGRKERTTPLTKFTTSTLKNWLSESVKNDNRYLFTNARGEKLSPNGVQYILRKSVSIAKQSCGSLTTKKVSPHVLRHTTAMQLLHSGVDIATIALWLGHESIETTNVYLQADLKIKEEALRKVNPVSEKPFRYKADDSLLSFLQTL